MRILIIDDSDSIRLMMEALLSARGDELILVGSGVEGLDKSSQLAPDIIVLDLNLRGAYDGFEVCTRLRASDVTRDTPIVVVTSRADEESRSRAVAAGVTAYYTKPFSPTALLKEIDSIKRRSSKMTAASKVDARASWPAPPPRPSSPAPPPQESGASLPAASEAPSPPPTDPRRRT
jgi:DNA-binding response OmpR family regulator